MIKIEIIGVESVIARFKSGAEKTRSGIFSAVERLGIALLNKVKAEKLTGQVLNVRTGRLKRSINNKMSSTNDTVSSSVGTNVVYARIHEFGGQTKRHPIFPKNGKALLFAAKGFIGPAMNVGTQSGRYQSGLIKKAVAGGGFQFAKAVDHPGSKMPMRSFLRSSLEEMRAEINQRLLSALGGI